MRHLLLTASLTALAAASTSAFAQQAPDPQATELAPVSVLATRTETAIDEAPATVSVITARQIEAMLATDIKDLVRFEPGVSVPTAPTRFGAASGTSGRAGNEGFTIRGIGGDRVLIVVDGIRSPDGFSFGAQSVGRGGYADLDLMRSVEILRGPASALYGSDGVAGAVSFVTRDPADLIRSGETFGGRARVGYNSADEGLSTSAAIAGRFGDFSAMLAWTGRDSQETETQGILTGEEVQTGGSIVYNSRDMANPQELSSDAWLGKLVWDAAPGHRLRLTYDSYESDMTANVISGRATRPSLTTPPASATAVLNLTAADTTERERISLDWRLDDVWGLDRAQVAVYRQDSTTRQFSFEDRVGTDRSRDNTFDNEVSGIAADATVTLGFNRLTFGADWSETTQQGVRSGTVPPAGETFPTSAFPKTDFSLGGVFIQDEITLLGGDLRIIPAIRYDSYDLTTAADPLYPSARADSSGDHVSPKLGVVWWASDTFGLFGNWGEGYKAPTPSQVNNFFSNIAFGYISRPNPDLRPETSQTVEIGARVRNLNIGGARVSGQVVAFQSDYQDFISQEVVAGAGSPADPSVFQWVNYSGVEISGFEAKANAYWGNGLSARFAYSYAEGDISDVVGTRPLESIDPTKVVIGLGYDAPGGLFGGQVIGTWSGGKDLADTVNLDCTVQVGGCLTSDDFSIVDITAYWNVSDNVTARAGVFNVFDETYSWWSDVRGARARTTPPQATSTPPPTLAYTQPGRNFGVSLSLRY